MVQNASAKRGELPHPRPIMKTLVIITSYNRAESLWRMVDRLLAESSADFVIFDDKSDKPLTICSPRVTQITNHGHRGKAGFWKTYNDIFNYCRDHVYDYYIILPDDVYPCSNFVAKAIEAFDAANCICMCPLLTNRSISAGVSRWGGKKIEPRDDYYRTHYFDCCGVVKRYFFEQLDWKVYPIQPSTNKFMSSGVGKQITLRLQEKRGVMCHVKRTLLSTTDDISQMNAEERKRHPMYANFEDNANSVDVYMASLWRGGHVIKTSMSLLRQPELNTLTICCNNYTDEQWERICSELNDDRVLLYRTNNEKRSNEKLRYLHSSKAKYIAMADDDLVYPEDYLLRMIAGCNIHDAVVSLHGSQFKEFPVRKYYGRSRRVLSWNKQLEQDTKVDVVGNGFALFKREFFTEDELKALYDDAPDVSMDDILMSCLCKKEGIDMYVLAHGGHPATHKPISPFDNYVFDEYKDNDGYQVNYLNTHLTGDMLVGI